MVSQVPNDRCGNLMLTTFATEEIGEIPSSPFFVSAIPAPIKNSEIINKRYLLKVSFFVIVLPRKLFLNNAKYYITRA